MTLILCSEGAWFSILTKAYHIHMSMKMLWLANKIPNLVKA